MDQNYLDTAHLLARAGFGASPAGPVPLDAGGPWEISGWTYDIAPGDHPGTWQLRELQARLGESPKDG